MIRWTLSASLLGARFSYQRARFAVSVMQGTGLMAALPKTTTCHVDHGFVNLLF